MRPYYGLGEEAVCLEQIGVLVTDAGTAVGFTGTPGFYVSLLRDDYTLLKLCFLFDISKM